MMEMSQVAPYRANRRVLTNEINGLLFTSVGFSGLLLTARMVYTGQLTFVFLVWNLFLATVPYFFSLRLMKNPAWMASRWT